MSRFNVLGTLAFESLSSSAETRRSITTTSHSTIMWPKFLKSTYLDSPCQITNNTSEKVLNPHGGRKVWARFSHYNSWGLLIVSLYYDQAIRSRRCLGDDMIYWHLNCSCVSLTSCKDTRRWCVQVVHILYQQKNGIDFNSLKPPKSSTKDLHGHVCWLGQLEIKSSSLNIFHEGKLSFPSVIGQTKQLVIIFTTQFTTTNMLL